MFLSKLNSMALVVLVTASLGGESFAVPENVGAKTPFQTYFAADAEYQGELLSSVKRDDIAAEAVTRRAVKLSKEGDRIAFRVKSAVNGLTIRYSLPDAPAGGGIDATLTLSVSGQPARKLNLQSHYTHLYFGGGKSLQKDPAVRQTADGYATAFFDEVSVLLPQPIPADSDVVLTVGPGDSAAYYVIDLLDAELVPPPRPCPSGYLSLADFGAVADDENDDTAALLACFAAAKAEKKDVYLPPGKYLQCKVIELDQIIVRGAGMWYTTLQTFALPPNDGPWVGNQGFRLNGKNIEVSDLRIAGLSLRRGQPYQRGFTGSADNFRLQNIWIEHSGVGMWLGNCRNGTIRDCRLRDNKADGINVNNGSENILIENNHARGNGDDSFASFSNTDISEGKKRPNVNITIRCNTSDSNWWGNGIGVYGGNDQFAEYNLVRGAQPNAGINVSTGHKSWPARNVVIRNNVIMNSGGTNWGQQFGSIWVFVAREPMSDIILEDNIVVDGLNDGLKLQGGSSNVIDLTCRHNQFLQTSGNGILIMSGARGKVVLDNNQFGRIGKQNIKNLANDTELHLDELDAR